MEWMTYVWTELEVMELEAWVDDNFVLIAATVFGVELVRYAASKALSWKMLGDSVANLVTLFLFLVSLFVVGFAYVAGFVYAYENYSVVQLPITGWTILGCLILADLAYYWEHRFLHSNGFAWGTHSVHHSSPFFNISVAYRFGPLDWFFPFFFHLPLILMGFNPFVVLMCETFVQLYQTLLHTEMVKKLPRPIEAVFNTPSHHRVHHAANKPYLDKNYAGILIIWDRLFGTFVKEQQPVRYGVHPAINTVNPIKIYFMGYAKLCKALWQAPNWGYRWNLLVRPPIWAWQQRIKKE